MTETSFDLDDQQQRAVSHPLGPLRIMAGAGSGKTEVMAQRVVALVQSGTVGDHEVLGLTFSNKAAANLRERIVKRLGPSNRVHVSTYHGFGAQLVTEQAIALGLPADPRLLDRARAFQLLLAEFDRVDLPHRKTGRPTAIVDEALALASSCADHLVSVAAVRSDCQRTIANTQSTASAKRAARSRLDLCTLVDAYGVAKRRLGYLDFGDQLALAVQALQADPGFVADLRNRYRAVLLDEFQDTNVAQRELLKMIWVDGFAPNTSPLTVVGDDLQAIYGFRGAHVRNLIGFADYVPGTVDVRLETNYRSGDAIVSIANHVQAQVPGSLPKVLRTHSTSSTAAIESFVAADDRHEAQTIAAAIAKQGAPWNEVAILCRKRRLIAPVHDALRALDIPVEIIGIGGLLSKPEIVDIMAWLRVLSLGEAEPAANVAVLRLLQGRQFRFGFRDLAALSRADRSRRKAAVVDASRDAPEERTAPPPDPGLDLRRVVLHSEVPEISVEAWRRLATFRSIATGLQLVLERQSLVDVIEAIIDAASLWSAVNETGHENLLRFLHLAHTFAPLDGPLTVASFIEYLDLVLLSEDEPAEASAVATDAVQLMTIHQAKGLEFDTVYVPGLAGSGSSRIFPDLRSSSNGATVAAALPHWLRMDADGFSGPPLSKGDEIRLSDHVKAEQESEEKRLLYVALTRARKRLVVSAAHWYSGPQKPQGPSVFYDLLRARPDLVTETSRAEAATEDPAVAAKKRRQAERSKMASPAPPPTTTKRKGTGPVTDALFELHELSPAPAPSLLPSAVAATALVTYANCPQRFAWSYVTPMPRRPSAAAGLGVRVHSWIEQQNRFPLSVDPLSSISEDILSAHIMTHDDKPTGVFRPDREQRCRESFALTPYFSLNADRVESAFLLPVPGRTVIRGRVDAAYQRNGMYEIVDFKTGRVAAPDDPSARLQLDLYALVAVDLWGVDPAVLQTSYCYLAPGDDTEPLMVTESWSNEAVARVRGRIDQLLDAIELGRFSPNGGSWCQSCDFESFCSGALRTEGQR
jgi:DNA helicase II / ATP-dependent DNA helicase PcrA